MTTPEASIFPIIQPPTSEHPVVTHGGPEETNSSPEPDHEVKWPDNKVFKFSSGHTLEFNNTDSSEYIRVKHGKRETKLFMTKDGTLDVAVEGDMIQNVQGETKLVTGSANTLINGDYFLDVKGDFTIRVGGTMKFELTESIELESFDGFDVKLYVENSIFNVVPPYGDDLLDELYGDEFSIEDLEEAILAGDPEAIAAAETPYELAQALLGATEHENTAALTAFIDQAIPGFAGQGGVKDVPWCAGFVNGVLAAQGQSGTGSLAARSFESWGTAVTGQPQIGDVVTFWRESPSSGKGHVGFFNGYDAQGNIKVLGGNQGDSVSVATYPANRVTSFRRAP